MKFSQLKKYAKEDIAKTKIQSAFIPLTIFTFFLTLTFMCASLRLLVSSPQIANSLFFLGDKSPIAVNIISSLIMITIFFLMFAPAYIALFEYFISPVKSKNQDINSIFNWYSFKRILVSLKVTFCLGAIKSFMFICFCAPSAVIIAGTLKSLFYDKIFKSVAIFIFIGAGAVLLIGLICFLCAKERYAVVPYIVAMMPDKKLKDAINASKRIMQGEYLKFFLFKLSFLPLFLSCVLIFPIAYVWTYYRQSCTEWIFYTVNKQKIN